MTTVPAKLKTTKSDLMSAGQEFAVSAVAAGLSHVIHHPLYTLKSQMMYYGPEFRITTFLNKVREQKSFLYRGENPVCYCVLYWGPVVLIGGRIVLTGGSQLMRMHYLSLGLEFPNLKFSGHAKLSTVFVI